MPLAASLRKRISTRNLHDLSDGVHYAPYNGEEGQHEGGQLRPQSANTNNYRAASRSSSLYSEHQSNWERPQTASSRPATAARNRFSLLKNRHASDPQLSTRWQGDASISDSSTPSACPAPVIGITAPTWESFDDRPKRKFSPFTSRLKPLRSKSNSPNINVTPASLKTKGVYIQHNSSADLTALNRQPPPDTSDDPALPQLISDTDSGLLVPLPRISASSASTDRLGSSSGRSATASSSASRFFSFSRRKKNKQRDSLFPLPVYLSPSNPRQSDSSPDTATIFPVQPSASRSPPHSSHSNKSPDFILEGAARRLESDIANSSAYKDAGDGADGKPHHITLLPTAIPLIRHRSSTPAPPASSAMAPLSGPLKSLRGRSNTMTSTGSYRDAEGLATPPFDTATRTSGSTTLGRNSLAGIRSWKQKLMSSEPQTPQTPPTASGIVSKEALIYPERKEGESAKQYYDRLEANFPKKEMAMYLSRKNDDFHRDVLRSLLRTFNFFEEPIDISLRKFVWEVNLLGEAQYIDRVVDALAQRYCECNAPIVSDVDEIYLVLYSLVILHSDIFNPSNKRKMTREEYLRNTRGTTIDDAILGCFYDNIAYTEFLQEQPEDQDSIRKTGRPLRPRKARKVKIAPEKGDAKGKMDPYDFILGEDGKLDSLRPALKGVMNLEDTFSYLGTAQALDIRKIRAAFYRPSMLQTTSERSRPEAFSNQATIENPDEASKGVVEIKVAKIGLLWRKDPKKKPIQSPWQEWGAMLTQSQVMFFRDHHWIKDLMKQGESQRKQNPQHPVIFRSKVAEFKPDYALKTLNILALSDSSYDKHKNSITLVNYENQDTDEVVLADNEKEMNDWLAKINYASAFNYAQMEIRPVQRLSRTRGKRMESITRITNDSEWQTSQQDCEDGPKPGNEQLISSNDPMDARKAMLRSKIGPLNEWLQKSQQKMDEAMRTARHVQVLAPFPLKTRSELLSFGARAATRLRRLRFDTWRWRTHRDIIKADLEDESWDDETGSFVSASKTSSPKLLPGALSRLNSRANAIINSQRPSRSSASGQRPPLPSKVKDVQGTFAGGMDDAFATPSDALSRSATASDGPWKLPPLTLGSEAVAANEADRPSSSGTESLVRPVSMASDASRIGLGVTTGTASEDNATPVEIGIGGSINGEKDFTHSNGVSGPRLSNHQSFRGFQKTLRSSQDTSSHRSRKGKETTDEGESLHGRETLARAPGSFKLHGKKASVITLPAEWQTISAEEKLKARKLAQAQENKLDPSETDEDEDETYRRQHSLQASDVGQSEFSSNLYEAPVVDNDGAALAYIMQESDGQRGIVTGQYLEGEEGEDEHAERTSSSTSRGVDTPEEVVEEDEEASSKYVSGTSTYFDAKDKRRSFSQSSEHDGHDIGDTQAITV